MLAWECGGKFKEAALRERETLRIVQLLSGERRNLVKNGFTERDVNAMLAELAAVCECLHKLILVWELAAYQLEQV